MLQDDKKGSAIEPGNELLGLTITVQKVCHRLCPTVAEDGSPVS